MKIGSDIEKIMRNVKRFLSIVLHASFAAGIIFFLIKLLSVKSEVQDAYLQKQYIIRVVQCVFGVLLIYVPKAVWRIFHFNVPVFIEILYMFFIFGAIFLGDVCECYYAVPMWDVYLHTLSSIITGLFGFIVLTAIKRDEDFIINISPVFAAFFAFTFSVTIGAFWEVYEYVFDGLLGLNMQKFITADGVVLAGHAALADTMKDIIVDILGAAAAALIGGFCIKKDKNWILNFSGFKNKSNK